MHCLGPAKAELPVLSAGENLTVQYVKRSGGLFWLNAFSGGAFSALCSQQSAFPHGVVSPAVRYASDKRTRLSVRGNAQIRGLNGEWSYVRDLDSFSTTYH